jgi:hypothetical protein
MEGTLSSTGTGPSRGAVEHAASTPRMAAGQARRPKRRKNFDMWVILLEALGALVLLVFIVWWTMFAGRKRGERKPTDDA